MTDGSVLAPAAREPDLIREFAEFETALGLGLTAEETDVGLVLFGAIQAGADRWALASATGLPTTVVDHVAGRLEAAGIWERCAEGTLFRYPWMEDLLSEDSDMGARGAIGFYMQVAAGIGMVETVWTGEEPAYQMNRGWTQPAPYVRRCWICLSLNTRGGRTCSPSCAKAWLVLRYHIHPASATAHRLSCARSVLANTGCRRHWEYASAVVGGCAPPPNRRFVVPDGPADRYAKELGIDLGYRKKVHQPGTPCPVPNLDGSRCRRSIRDDRIACHIHRPTAERAWRIEAMALDIERELVEVFW